MTHLSEPSSSLSFTSSSHLSNCTSPYALGAVAVDGGVDGATAPQASSLEIVSLRKLSSSLESLLVDHNSDFSDAEIVVEGVAVPVHRCILASRSNFFSELFSKKGDTASGRCCTGDVGGVAAQRAHEGRPRYYMSELVPHGQVRVEAFRLFLGYLYTGKLQPSPPEVSTCVDLLCVHDACSPAIGFAVELMYASSVFQITELVSLFQRRLLDFIGKAHVEDVLPILLVAFQSQLGFLLDQCVQRVACSDLDDVALEKDLPAEAVGMIKSIRCKSWTEESNIPGVSLLQEKRIRRIYRALDSHDVELVKLLLEESDITLDGAFALHYAVAYCDSKIVKEILALGLANVDLKNNRGYTPIHLAAMRREPAIMVSLLDKGASASEMTEDGQTAVSICRRLTRSKDYYSQTERCQESNKGRLCIEVLEQELRRNPTAGEESVTSPVIADDLHYLENRVAFARLLFPTEAKVAMDIARCVDLNETPSMPKKRPRSRMETLMRTVKLGRRYFPNCSQVLDEFMDDDHADLLFLEKGNSDEQKIKRKRFNELKEEVLKAFTKDKAEIRQSGTSLSSLAASQKGDRKPNRVSSRR